MLSFALNHMTVPQLSAGQAGNLGRALGMVGIELRNDLARPLFDGQLPTPRVAGGLDVLALAEVKAFNAFDAAKLIEAVALMDLAVASGAGAIALIPQVGGQVAKDGLRDAMIALAPELERRSLVGLIEPIGFENSTLRTKAEVVALIDDLELGWQFGVVHDTFHHHLADEAEIYPLHTKIVHVSGVVCEKPRAQMTDADRVLVDAGDRLGNIAQIKDLRRGGYRGPFSFEAFSPDVHAADDPKAALSRSIYFIKDAVMAHAA